METFKKSAAILWFFVALLILDFSQPAVAAGAMQVKTQENTVTISRGERLLLRYRYGDVPYKPYVDRLYSPGGVNVLLDAPHDHLHHHALMYAITADGVNFWEEHNAPGRQVHLRFNDTKVGSHKDVSCAGFGQQLNWVNPRSGELLLKEQRRIEACEMANSNVTFLTWESRLEPAKGRQSVTLSGSHYQGLGLRFVRSMDADGEFRNTDGKAGKIYRGDERLVRSRWCAYTAKVDGKEVTVAMFDHPENERHPATWFTMSKPFAYLSATQALHEQPLKVLPDKPLELRYGVALWDGRTETEQIEKLYKSWTALPRGKEEGSKPQMKK